MALDTLPLPDFSGKQIRGYALLELIGKGGFGAVYRAYQPAVKREVAVKIILPEYLNHPEFVRRFEAEAQLVAHLEHMNIVPLYDFWREPTGAFLVMRWLRGGSLRTALENGAWPLDDTLRLVEQIVGGLATAHRYGVIHRDLKPDNILLDEEKNAYLADFGIAKDLQNITQMHTLYAAEEQQGRIMGSPYYLSPEQIKAQGVSQQSDIYSLGVMLYEILTGQIPFQGLPLSIIITKHLQEPLPHLHESRPDLPESLHHVITKATEKDPANRYPTALELLADFRQAFLSGESALPQSGNGLDQRDPEVDMLAGVRTTIELTGPEFNLVEPINPYKGLRAFEEADADDFFGRETLVQQLISRMVENGQKARFLAVVGPSGSGKSSVVKAGILPSLRQGAISGSNGWYVIEMTPGTHPLEELEAALLRIAVNPPASLLPQLREDERGLVRAVKRILPGNSSGTSELVLVIDQLEEIFTLAQDETERSHFLALLLSAARDPGSQMRVIVTLRADFYDRPLLYGGFGELMRESTEVVLPLNREELERAIVEPAEHAGLRLEAGLIEAIIRDVGEQPGSLPLLQYALTELFERREGRRLTLRSYLDIGGVSGALARRADELFAQLDEAGQKAVRQIFLRLITLNEGVEDTRRRVRQDELLSMQGDERVIQKVIEQFGKYRLLTFDHDPQTRIPTVEVAHEALIRRWQRLRDWVKADRENLHIQRRLAVAAEEWLNAGKDPSFLASGSRLDQFEVWAGETDLALTGNESAYLAASLSEREKQRAAEAARKAKEAALERRSRRFLRALVVVLAVATLGALVLTGLALNQRQAAVQNAATATIAQGQALVQADNAATAAAVAQISAAESRSLAFASGAQLALSNNNTDLAILLALAANDNGQSTIQTQRTLAEAAYAPGTRRVYTGHTDRVTSVAMSPDGKTAASGSRDNSAILWNVATGEVLHRLEGHTNWVWDVAFSPDGAQVLTASQDQTLILWDAATGEEIRQFEGHTDAVRSVVFSADSKTALSGSYDASLILWDVETGEMIRHFQGSSPIYDVALSQSGFTALSGNQNGMITLWNAQSGEPLLQLGSNGDGHTGEVWSVVYTPDEQGVISASDDSSLILWGFETGQPVRRFEGHNSRVTSVAFSPDGKSVASASEDNTIIVWDVATASILHRFTGHTSLVYGVTFTPDGKHIVSASWDSTLRLWDIENGAQVRRYGGHTGEVLSVQFSPDGKRALSASEDNSLVLWDIESGQEIYQLQGHTAPVDAVVFSPDGHFALSGSDDFSLLLWNLDTGKMVRRFGGSGSSEGHSDGVWAVAYSPDGKTAVSGSRDNTLIIWDVESGKQINRLFGHTFRITGVAFSPDGRQIISGGFDNLLILWDASTGKEIRRFEGHTDWVRSVAFSSDGKTVLSGSADNSLILWDVATGKRLRQFEGHTAQVYSVAFSPDGRYAVSGSADSSLILWDVVNGNELLRYAADSMNDVRSVAFSPDGRYVLSGSGDASVRLWQASLSPADLIQWIKVNRYLRDFTCAERALYSIEPRCATPTPVIEPGSI